MLGFDDTDSQDCAYNPDMKKVIAIDAKQDDKSLKQKEFRALFASNLNAALDRRGSIPIGYGRAVAVAEIFGVSQNTAAGWLKGEGVPEASRLPEIAEALNTTLEQLLVGDVDTGAHAIDERYTIIEAHGDEERDGYALYTLPETLRSVGLPREVRILRIASDDMEPYVRSGDLAIYDPRVNRIRSNGVYVLHLNDKYFLRRAQRDMKHNIRLICDNERFGSESLTDEDFAERKNNDGRIAVIGYVVAHVLIGH